MNLSFREKTLWAELGVTLSICAYYLVAITQNSYQTQDEVRQLMNMLMNFLYIGLGASVGFWILLGCFDKKAADDPLDEREKFCELKCNQYGYWIQQIGLAMGVISYGLEHQPNPYIELPAYAPIHLIVLTFLLAELVVTSAQLVFLRRGIYA